MVPYGIFCVTERGGIGTMSSDKLSLMLRMNNAAPDAREPVTGIPVFRPVPQIKRIDIMTKELDCRGLACPEPVIRCRRLLEEEKPSALHVLVDNAAASENVSRFLGRNGYSVEVKQEDAAIWKIAATTSACSCNVTEPAAAALAPGRTLVLVTTETLGRGDDQLGEKLMGNFLSTLPELGESLWRVVLLNGGVKLAAVPGKALDSLKALEAAGTDILVCGTCLAFYGLLEARQVGQTTNMLDVVTSLALADKIIRP